MFYTFEFDRSENAMFESVEVGFGLVLLGIILAVVAVVILVTSNRQSGGRSRAAGILLIGPIPIMFGTDRESVRTLAMLAVLLILIVLIFMFLPSILVGR